MKILYLTMESVETDPILNSQVIPLLEKISMDVLIDTVTLVTFETNGIEISNNTFNHKPIIKKGKINSQIQLLKFLLLNRKGYDVIHVRSYMPMFISIIVKKILNKRLVFDPRGLFADEVLYDYKATSFFNVKKYLAKTIKLVEPYLYNQSDSVVLVSNFFKDYIVDKYHVNRDKCFVIPTFSVPPHRNNNDQYVSFRSTNKWEDKIVICYSGSLEKWQQIDEILHFCKYASTYSNKFRFCFFSKDISAIKEKVSNYIPSSLCFFGSFVPAELTMALSEGDYGLLFRDKSIVNQVAAPIKFKDYLCSGLEVIVNQNIGDCAEVLNDTGFGFVIDGDLTQPSVILDKMSLRSLERKNEISKVATKNYGLQTSFESYLSIYKGLL
ncbi:glycosyltransferase [Colwellia sp. BRX8-7]|jgi:hypothetical protein|uniref:glycosyltransferase n=1 Tax=Colwellia sp. BRX8-7 TaxID=2759833 RepID=UPI0015F473E6|nr:glycosyltransferase [Colwellia sp. BRX8-7]MBA6335656.1 glycosyltransferase [Colwellia sp. BRX8-7]